MPGIHGVSYGTLRASVLGGRPFRFARRLEATGPIVQVFGGVTAGKYSGFDFSLSDFGDLVYSGLGEAELGLREPAWVDRSGATRSLDEDWPAAIGSVAVAPDCDLIAATIGTNSRRRSGSLHFISDRGGDRALYPHLL